MQNNRQIGSKYEEVAVAYLERKGYKIVTCNYRCKLGEIDIIAVYENMWIFVEVKYRRNRKTGDPLEAVTWKKQHRISQCANYYLLTHRLGQVAVRFDVIGIMGDNVTHVENAFDYC